MRKSFIFTILIFSLFCLRAQVSGIRDTFAMYDDKLRPAIELNLETDDYKDFKKYMKKYFSQKHDINLSESKMQFSVKEIVINSISPKEVDFFVDVRPMNVNEITMTTFLRFGYDFYVNEAEHPIEYKAFKDFVRQFARDYAKDYYAEKIKEHNKALEKSKKEKTKLLKTNEKLVKSTQKNDKKMRKLQKKNAETPQELAEVQAKTAELEAENVANRAALDANNQRINSLQEEIAKHNSELMRIQERINSIQ